MLLKYYSSIKIGWFFQTLPRPGFRSVMFSPWLCIYVSLYNAQPIRLRINGDYISKLMLCFTINFCMLVTAYRILPSAVFMLTPVSSAISLKL